MTDFWLVVIGICAVILTAISIVLYLGDRKRNRRTDKMMQDAEQIMKGISEQNQYYADLHQFILDNTNGHR